MMNSNEAELDDTSGNDDLYEHFRFVANKGQILFVWINI